MSVYPGSASKKATSTGRRPQQQQQRGEGRGLLSCCALSLPGQGRLGGGADKGRRRARPRGRPARKMGSRRPVATPAHARRRDIVANGPPYLAVAQPRGAADRGSVHYATAARAPLQGDRRRERHARSRDRRSALVTPARVPPPGTGTRYAPERCATRRQGGQLSPFRRLLSSRGASGGFASGAGR